MKDPYAIVQSRYITEKARVLEQLHLNEKGAPKYVFLVDVKAKKPEIAQAIEQIYAERKIKVVAVNTVKSKPKRRRVRGKEGWRAAFKKAIVTLEKGDSIEEKV